MLRARAPAIAYALAVMLRLPNAAPAWAQDHAPALVRAVRDFDPTLSLPAEGGLIHVADFDGDGRDDVAAVLEGSARRALIVFRAAGEGYEPFPLYATLPPVDFELRVVPPGSRRVLGLRGVLAHGRPALELVFPGRASALYVWRQGRFQVFGTESY